MGDVCIESINYAALSSPDGLSWSSSRVYDFSKLQDQNSIFDRGGAEPDCAVQSDIVFRGKVFG